jgi:uncharacterized protein YjbI with pentapeptide repeats
MEVLEAKPASRRARFWARLSDSDTPPRSWWFPPSSRRDEVSRMPEAARQDYQKVVEQAHEKFSETVRLAMLSLLGFALFCLLIAFSAPDSTLLVADPTIKMPFADVQVSFQSFLILAPFLLIVVTLYLHIFYGYWLDLETDLQHLTLSRKSSEPPIERLPTLFSLNHPVPRLLTAFIFYWLVPLVLVMITWKAAARLAWGLPLAFITSLVVAILVFLQIRRCPASQRHRNRRRWVVIALILAWLVAMTFNPLELERQLNIYRADLSGKWLPNVDLHNVYADHADLQHATLSGANLKHADLSGAKLQHANFASANLENAQLAYADLQHAQLASATLRGASLWNANLQGTNFPSANLQNATLAYTKLQDARLAGANLQGADLHGANIAGANIAGANLQGADLQGANLQSTDLRGANLQGVNVAAAYFHKNRDLESIYLGGANLPGANLPGANLPGADLQGTNLQGADLQNVDLRGANLQEVKGLTKEQIQAAHTDEKTKLPPDLKLSGPAEHNEVPPPPAGTTPME